MSGMHLYRVRAGWYETAPEPAPGVFTVSKIDDCEDVRTYWNLAVYALDTDGGLDLRSTGDAFATLGDAKRHLRRRIDGDGIRGTCYSCGNESDRLAFDCSPFNRMICPDCSY